MAESETTTVPVTPRPRRRHALPVRVAHWLNLLFLLAMLGSGLQIFNAHPALYWGNRSDEPRAWLAMDARLNPAGEPEGITRIAGHEFHTTGLFGLSGESLRGFPHWMTIPGDQWLAMGRRWHFFFAWLLVLNGLFYVIWSAGSRHLTRDLVPGGNELRHFGATLGHHFHLRQLRDDSERGYNALQQISYLVVIFGLLPLMVLTGLAMSPRMDAAFHWLPELFGGRQSARSIHFITAWSLVAFTLVHVIMVALVGPVRYVRAMFTGELPPRGKP